MLSGYGYLRPTADIASDVLLPGDPGRALALAQELLDTPRMANHSRGLWGYSGTAVSGAPLTIQASGIGGPSLAVVVEELARHGAERVIRIGTCRGLDPTLRLGEVVAASEAVAADGTSRALGAHGTVRPERSLHTALLAGGAGIREARVASVDLCYERPGAPLRPAAPDVPARDMATAALFALGTRRGLATASLLVVAAAVDGSLEDEALEEASLRLGRCAAGVLGAAYSEPDSDPARLS